MLGLHPRQAEAGQHQVPQPQLPGLGPADVLQQRGGRGVREAGGGQVELLQPRRGLAQVLGRRLLQVVPVEVRAPQLNVRGLVPGYRLEDQLCLRGGEAALLEADPPQVDEHHGEALGLHGGDVEVVQVEVRQQPEVVLQKVPSEFYPKVRNHGEGPY